MESNMLIKVLAGKIHRAAVTGTNAEYEGSISISKELVDLAGMKPYQNVLVADVTNGARFETYVIVTDEPGRIVLNGAAARLGSVDDRVIIMAFAYMTDEEYNTHRPRVVLVDEKNRPIGK
jgi:aspartate 1-decarboxylase